MAKAKTEYTVVARRYRPQQFDDLVGQEAVAQALRNALTSDRVAHAYLFTGARGVGKTSTARILAKALNCEKGPTPTPCDKCTSCLAIAEGDDVDVREIDGASHTGVDDIRAIRIDVSTRPTRSRYKIYIIDEVHMLSKNAFNALLKTLEEPPPHVKFIFATTEALKVPITILSRCQRFDFGNISAERIADQLRAVVKAEKMKADDDAIDVIARRAAGSMRDAQSLLDQLLAFGGERLTGEMVQHLLGVPGPERVLALADAVMAHDPKRALERLQEFVDAGLAVGELLDQLIDHWRDLMIVACAGKEAKNLNTPTRFRAALDEQVAACGLDTILAGLDVLVSAKNRLRGSGQAQTLVQMALIRLSRLDDLTPLSQLALWLSQPGNAPAATGVRHVTAPTPSPTSAVTLPPEGKKKPVTAEPAAPASLSERSLPSIWPEIVAQLGIMFGSQLQKAGLPAISGPNTLVLRFAAEYNAAYEHCSVRENLPRIEAAVKAATGQAWVIRLEKKAGAGTGTVNGAAPPPPPRVRQQEAMQQHPILKRALEVFDALPMFMDAGFGTEPPPEPVTETNPDHEA
jgi:DNA polymerase-3 subunit gamma/tau